MQTCITSEKDEYIITHFMTFCKYLDTIQGYVCDVNER